MKVAKIGHYVIMRQNSIWWYNDISIYITNNTAPNCRGITVKKIRKWKKNETIMNLWQLQSTSPELKRFSRYN